MNNTLTFEIDDKATAETLAYAAKKMELGHTLLTHPTGYEVAVNITEPVQAYDFAMATYDVMKRHAIDSRKRERLKLFDKAIEENREFIEAWVKAYDQVHRFVAVDAELREQARRFCDKLKKDGVYGAGTFYQDIMSNFYRHYKGKNK